MYEGVINSKEKVCKRKIFFEKTEQNIKTP